MDLSFMERFLPMYVTAAQLTLNIALIGIAISVVIGIAASLALYYRIPGLRQLVAVYVELSRNTPLLVQLFFLYFGLPKIGIRLSPEICGIIGLSFLGGAYMTETFRAGLETVERIQSESALSLGMSQAATMRYVILPLADLMYVTKDLIGIYYQTPEALFMLVMAYLVLLLPISLFGSWVERRLRYAGFGN